MLNSKHSWLEEADVFEKVHSLFQIYVGMDMYHTSVLVV